MTTEFWTIVSTVSAIVAALGAIIVPNIIYNLSKRPTEPWVLKRLEDTKWQLKHVGKTPVWVTHFLNFHGGQVTVVNDAGRPSCRGLMAELKFSSSVPKSRERS